MKLKFPKDFFWGAATSAHQVEGGNDNDWTLWEKKNARRLAREAKNCWQKWQREEFPEMLESVNYISGRACDHYNLFNEDFNLAKRLGHNAHRFSIEWSRVEPEGGKFNEKEIKHYQVVIESLRKRGLEPFLTLYHWTLPVWFVKKGGWLNKDAPEYFARYAEKVLSQSFTKGWVKFCITLNEPQIYASQSFLRGNWPPQKRNLLSYLKVLRNLAKAHKKAFQAIKQKFPQAQIGIAKNNIYFKKGWLTPVVRWWWNHWFLKKIKNYQDFIGLNYYFTALQKKEAGSFSRSDLGWEIYPQGIYFCLKELSKYKRPIYILENGIADAKDFKRTKFIKDHLYWTLKAMQEGADVRGYFYWSLMDNFEWDKGFWPRFGLAETDYKTLERKIRPSAWEYKKIIEN
jgi:beta-glucosidase